VASRRLDLDTESRRVLEFDEVLDLVAACAATPMGAARIRNLEPEIDPVRVASEQAAVEEALRHIQSRERFLSEKLPDPVATLKLLAVEDMGAGASDLRDLASVLLASDHLRARLGSLPPEEYPYLHGLGTRMPSLRQEANTVVTHVAPDGHVLDGASPELRRLRGVLGRVGEKLRRMLLGLLRDPGAEAVIQDDFITQRNGRFVVPVRVDTPRPMKGIVHATSSSGATVFVEPLESVELNNELVHLAEQEQEEQGRILRSWTQGFRNRLDDVIGAVKSLTVLDSLQARAVFADVNGGIRPTVEGEGNLVLRQVRHPLLDRRLREEGGRCVPLTLQKASSQPVLVLSGPNTGGKTVALKTVGLSVLMAQAGIHVLAEEARLPLFKQVRADIGDHQSIRANLSTFSAHVRAVVRFMKEASPPALFLFDEIGTGTEPVEGAALAQAVLERLVEMRISTVATTHQGSLKAWAFTTAGAMTAAMEFDAKTLRPTYRVLMDTAGVSAGLDIASRLELPEVVVRRARSLLSAESREAESYLTRLQDQLAGLEREREGLERRRQELEDERRDLREEAELEAERRRRETSSAFRQALDEWGELARREIEAVEESKEKSRLLKRHQRARHRLRLEADRRLEDLASGEAGPRQAGEVPFPLEPGVRIRVRSLGREGEIVRIRGDQVSVRLGNTVFEVDREDLEGCSSDAPSSSAPRLVETRLHRSRPEPFSGEELHLLGKTVDEALSELDKFLDEAALAGRGEVRVVHGYGTGRLRSAVRSFLKGHAHVDGYRAGSPREGGDGATVVVLKT